LATKKFIIVTTINPISKGIRKLSTVTDYKLVVVGDKKTPQYKENNIIFLDVKKQENLKLKSVRTCPFNAYQRKNIGYLYAIKNGAEIIFETDDDNIVYNNWKKYANFSPPLIRRFSHPKIFNVYSEFTKENIWPRGFPLEYILSPKKKKFKMVKKPKVGIWQGLVNDEPDVDAVHRLTKGQTIQFKDKASLILGKNVFCPFNSQNTFWHESFFPYLYLPITVGIRFTDILRGYVAQRCLWEHDAYLGFTKPTVFQKRNVHNLMLDFEDEIPMYLLTNKVIKILSGIKLTKSPFENLIKVYSILQENKVVNKEEIKSVKNWIDDIKSF